MIGDLEASLRAIRTPMPDAVATIARQLETVQRLFGYRYGRTEAETATLTQALATFLASYGVRDIRDVGVCEGDVADWRGEGATGQPTRAHMLCDEATGVVLYGYRWNDNIPIPNVEPWQAVQTYAGYEAYGPGEQFGPYVQGAAVPFLAVDLPDRYYVIFSAKWTDSGVPYFIPTLKRRSSLSEDLRFILGVVLMAVPGINAVIGNALFGGTFLSSYPALASIATNTILSTALNGGDIERAVTSALAGHAGGLVGGQVTSAFDSALAGRLAGVAASAALQGADVDAAVQNALLRYGAGAAGDFVGDVVEMATAQVPVQTFDIDLVNDAASYAAQGETNMFDMDAFGAGDFGLAAMQGSPLDEFATLDLGLDDAQLFNPVAALPIAPEDYADADFNYTGEVQTAPYIAPENYADADFYYGPGPASAVAPIAPEDYADADFDYGEGVQTAPAPVAGAVPPPTGGYTIAEGIRDVSALAMAAIQINAAYQRTQAPAVQAGARTSAGGATVTGQSNGMVVVRNPNGQTQVQRPPQGVPYGTADGSVIVNNGDGTYTIAGPTGGTQTRPYERAASGGVDSKTLLIGGGVALAAFLALR